MNDQEIFALKSNLSNFVFSLPKNGTSDIVKFIWAEGHCFTTFPGYLDIVGRQFGHWVLQIGDSYYYYLTYEYSENDENGIRVENLEFKRDLVENLSKKNRNVISRDPIVMGTTNRLDHNQILLIGKSLLMNFDKYRGYWDSLIFLQIFIELLTIKQCLRIDIPIGGVFRLDHDFYSKLKHSEISEDFREILRHSANEKGVDFEEIARKRRVRCTIS